MTLREAIDQPDLQAVRDRLRRYRTRKCSTLPSDLWRNLSELKHQAVSGGDQMTAKAVWCLETIGHAQDSFVSAFKQLQAGDFKKAWDDLESCENQIVFLDRHFPEKDDEFGVEHARVHTQRLQDLFPLTWAFSPAFLYKEVVCSICGAKQSLRSGCEHVGGEIYDGEMCGRVVTSSELLHVALVTNPARKISYIFPEDDNPEQLLPIKELATALGSPWRRWSYQKEERRLFHPAFRKLGRNDRCPCMSGAKYKNCCLHKERVFPHFQISLDEVTTN